MEATILSTEAIAKIIGCKPTLPLTAREMVSSLTVAFYPTSPDVGEPLIQFLGRLRAIFTSAGARVLTYEEALSLGHHNHVAKGIVLIAAGEGEPGNLAIDHVAGLADNTVVGVYYGKLPGAGESRFQKRVDALVGALVWHMVHVLIYVDDESWTICNMNGAIDTFSLDQLGERAVDSLIPKLAAPVVPPRQEDFVVRKDAFDPYADICQESTSDIVAGATIWRESGLLASQTRLGDLSYRNHKYKRIAAAYLSARTGMSYGFLSRQLPVLIRNAMDLNGAHPMLRRVDWTQKDFIEIDGELLVVPNLWNRRFVLKVPQVTVICTRSGCDKGNLDPRTDLVTLTLSKGRIILGLAKGVEEDTDCQPSFDTLIILSHAIGNAIVASILNSVRPTSPFGLRAQQHGLAIAHWHGFIDATSLPEGYYLHGESNPPVSCSTPQAALYALVGKLAVFERCVANGQQYLGDAHIEPSHGTNMCGGSIRELAELIHPSGFDARAFLDQSRILLPYLQAL
jgi:hypothetical protein